MSVKKMQLQRASVLAQITELENQLSQLPEGHIICAQNGKYIKMNYILDGKSVSLSKKQESFMHLLVKKKYLEARLQDLTTEKNAIEAFLRHYKNYESRLEKLLKKSAYRALLSGSIKPAEVTLADWSTEPFETNQTHPEQLRHPCLSGHIVRSKSEVLIDQALFTHQIPFRYESILKLGEVILFPDFTIRHPYSGELFLWEHFGKMDYPPYAQNAFQKMQLYTSHGYIPTVNLITSFETQNNPLTTATIETIIQQYFL